jgi:hypothetical protein
MTASANSPLPLSRPATQLAEIMAKVDRPCGFRLPGDAGFSPIMERPGQASGFFFREIARPHTATPRRVRPQWRHSPRAGGGSKESPGCAEAFKEADKIRSREERYLDAPKLT